jgi:hypothetical protein
MSTDENQPEIDLAITPIQNSITRETAQMAYNFMMTGTVARLYLYLFGEFDKDYIEVAVEKIRESKSVMESILNKDKTPMRAYYDFLIERGFFEDQNLCDDAMLFIDMPDRLQLRICDKLSEQVADAANLLASLPKPEETESKE